MALSQKLRLLSLALPDGLAFSEVDGIRIMYLCHMPYKLERTVLDWIGELPEK